MDDPSLPVPPPSSLLCLFKLKFGSFGDADGKLVILKALQLLLMVKCVLLINTTIKFQYSQVMEGFSSSLDLKVLLLDSTMAQQELLSINSPIKLWLQSFLTTEFKY